MIDTLKLLFRENTFPVHVAYLFGSHATGTEGPLSDVDVGVVFPTELPRKDRAKFQLEIMGKVMEKLRRERVDVVSLRDASLLLQHRAVSTGVLLYEQSPVLRVRYETEMLRNYLDFQPASDFYFEKMRERIRGGTFGNG